MEERGHVLHILKKVKEALESKNYVKIKSLSNKIIHSSSIDQDPDLVYAAVIVYALSKLIEREQYKSYKNWPNFYKNYTGGLTNLIKALEINNIQDFHNQITFIINLIQGLSGNLKIYINDVFRKAKINKASRIYEHGISMEKTAKILGITVWELAEYAGQTRIADINLAVTMPIRERIKTAEEIFR